MKINFKENEQMLKDMKVRLIEGEDESCPDVVFYKDGPQFWAELVQLEDESFDIEDLRQISQE